MRNRTAPRLFVFAALVVTLAAAACGPRQPRQPSIVVLVVDDLGAVDLPSYGHPRHATPNIDRLAREGLRFTRAYAASPVCAPTRAALLTGKSPARLHLTHSLPPLGRAVAPLPAPAVGPPEQPLTEPASATWLEPGEVTIAEALRARGYATALVGKWHLGKEASGPRAQGFDVAIGGEEEAAPPSWFDPYGLPLLADRAPGEYLTDRLTAEAEAFLERNARRPFFLVLSHFAVHTPIAAPAERVAEWRRRLSGDAAPTDARVMRSLDAEYAAMIAGVDESVGRILDKLSELGIERDTLVVLTSDNGGLLETPETGQAVTSNAPLRGGKASLYEGGLRVPLVVRWPAAVAAGRETDAMAATVDWFPTLLEVADRARPRPRPGDSVVESEERDGRSLLAILEGQEPREERALHFHYPHYIAGYRHDPGRETYWNTPGAAILAGTTKLIRRFDGAVELYDVADDPGETRDLSSERPEEVARLAARLDQWLAAEDAHLPEPNQAYDSGAFERGLAEALARLGRTTDWTPNGGCTTAVRDGRLTLDCESHPFIVGPEMVVRGPLRIEVRCSATGTAGAGAIWYRGSGKATLDGDRIGLPACGPELATREARIAPATTGTIHQLRLDFSRPRSGGRVEIDWIRLYRDDRSRAPIVEWSFDR